MITEEKAIKASEIKFLFDKWMKGIEHILDFIEEENHVLASYNLGILSCSINNAIYDFDLEDLKDEEDDN